MTKRKLCNGRFKVDEVRNIVEYFNVLYPQEEDCFVKIFSKSTKEYKFYNLSSLRETGQVRNILNSFGKNNLMISTNTFKTMQRATEGNLFSINNICIDIDYKKIDYLKELSPEKVIKLLEMDCIGSLVPSPNYIEFSNQIRFIYVLKEPVYIPKGKIAVRTLCNRISEHFANELKEYGAETQKAEKFIRVPFSINTKTLDTVKIIHYEEDRYSLKELQEMWLDDLPLWYENWKDKKQIKKPKNNIKDKVFDIKDFNRKRLSDFRRIQYYLNVNDIKDLRSRLCFLYHDYSLLIYKNDTNIEDVNKKALEDMVEFNNNFKYPLPVNRIISDTKNLRRKQYIYGNISIMNFLELDDTLCKELHLESIFKTKSKQLINQQYYEHNKEKLIEISKEYYENNKEQITNYKKQYYEKNKRQISERNKDKYKEKLKKENKVSMADKKEITKAKIKDLLAEGLSRDNVATTLNISMSTVKRYISLIKKEELLA